MIINWELNREAMKDDTRARKNESEVSVVEKQTHCCLKKRSSSSDRVSVFVYFLYEPKCCYHNVILLCFL